MADGTPTIPCSWDGCDETYPKPARGRPPQHCPAHTRERRRAESREYARTHRPEGTCTEAECDRPIKVKSRGLCGMHYRRWERANGMANPPSDTWGPRQRANWKKRHAIKRGANRERAETIYPESIYLRDAWVCQLCNEPVDRTLTFPHLMSASLDHRIPLAKGGTHTRDNVQLTHFACNAKKGSKRAPSTLTTSD